MAQGNPVKHKKKTKSVLKNIRQTERRAAVNRMNRTRVRTAMRRMRAALGSADAAGAAKLASETLLRARQGDPQAHAFREHRQSLQIAAGPGVECCQSEEVAFQAV